MIFLQPRILLEENIGPRVRRGIRAIRKVAPGASRGQGKQAQCRQIERLPRLSGVADFDPPRSLRRHERRCSHGGVPRHHGEQSLRLIAVICSAALIPLATTPWQATVLVDYLSMDSIRGVHPFLVNWLRGYLGVR